MTADFQGTGFLTGSRNLHDAFRGGAASSQPGRAGVTLIELMIVITIMGLLAGASALRLTGMSGRARFQQAIERIQYTDAALRARAVHFNEPCRIELKLGSPVIQRICGTDDTELPDIRLPEGVKVTRIRSPTRDVSSGRFTVHYSALGSSDSYAFEITGAGKEPLWLLFAGRTGQVMKLEQERDVESILEASLAERSDAR